MRSPALSGASGTIRPAPCAAMTSKAVRGVAGSVKAARKQASDPNLMMRPSACHDATWRRYRRGEAKIASPWPR
jgi:hypothetical protein